MTPPYSTSDLSLASAIVAAGFRLDHIEKHDSKGVFFFEPSHSLSCFAEDYFLGKTRVDPQQYTQVLKGLKTSLYHAF